MSITWQLLLAGAGLFLFVVIAAVLGNILIVLRNIGTSVDSWHSDWRKLNEEALDRTMTREYDLERKARRQRLFPFEKTDE